MGLDPGTKLGAFEITGLLGKGGMGEVYRARDTKLGRDVAIKVLPENFARDTERLARFEREAKLLASLDHPNIGALHEFQEIDGVHFLILQLIEGETLADRIAKGALSIAEALPLFIHIAQGLAAAHERGIVHRDLKPDNVKIAPDGLVKVLDFGIAKSTVARPQSIAPDAPTTPVSPLAVTAEGTFIGTPTYMAPEQARGKDVDKRADVWAFGCCLFEALTGLQPFTGETITDVVAAIVERQPDWTALPKLPAQVESVLRRCLEKDPNRRLSSMGDLAITLEEAQEGLRQPGQEPVGAKPQGVSPMLAFTAAIATLLLGGASMFALMRDGTGESSSAAVSQARKITSLAVLPFENLMGDETKEYFVDGMTDTLTAELSKIRSIKVIARTSAMKFKNSDTPLSEIARQLGVDGLIEGSVQQFGDEVRITAQLIDGRSEAHLWGENFEGTLAGVMKLQGEVAVSIAEQIGAVLTPEERDKYAEAKDVNPEAYDLYLRGRSTMQSRLEKDLLRAIELFESATMIEPEYALAYSGMADAFTLMNLYAYASVAETEEKAFRYARQAVELDDTLSNAFTSLGLAYLFFQADLHWAEAERAFLRAIALNPGSERTHRWYSDTLWLLGRVDDALREAQLAVELDPLNALATGSLGSALHCAERFDEAETAYLRSAELDPSLNTPLRNLAWMYSNIGRYEDAVEYAERAYAITKTGASQEIVLNMRAVVGGPAAIQNRITEIEIEQGEHSENLAVLYAALGDFDKVFLLLEKQFLAQTQMNVLSLRTWGVRYTLEARRDFLEDPRFWALFDRFDFPPLPPEHPRYAYEQAYLRQKAAEAALAAQPKPVRRFSLNLDPAFPMAASAGGLPELIAVSPQGDTLYYVSDAGGERKIVARAMSRFESVPIRGSDGASGISLSPDGSRLAFSANGAGWTLPVDGGTPQRANGVFPIPGTVLPFVWVDDNSLALFPRPGTPFRAFNVDTETMRELSQTPGPTAMVPFSFDHKNQLLFLTTAPPNFVSYVLDLKSSELKMLTEGEFAISIPTGGVVLGRFEGTSISVMISAFDASRRELTGRPISMFEGTRFPGIGVMAFSQNGHFFGPVLPSRITALNVEDLKHDLVWVEMDGTETSLGVRPLPYTKVRVFGSGPDQRIAVDLQDQSDIWIVESDGSLNRFTFGFPSNASPMWSPDGTEIFFLARVESLVSLYRKPSDLSQEPKKIPLPGVATPYDWTPDGASLIAVHQNSTDTAFSMSTIHVTDDGRLETLVSSEDHGFFSPALSPNGRWIAYGSNETDPPNIFVRSWPDLRVVGQISEDGGREPMWSADGSALFYRGPTHMMETPIRPTGTFTWDAHRQLFEDNYLRIEGLGGARSYDYDPVANRFLMVKEPQTTGPTEIIVIENWAEEIRARLAEAAE